jgi:membrane fusion protein (multidrug efflux system)
MIMSNCEYVKGPGPFSLNLRLKRRVFVIIIETMEDKQDASPGRNGSRKKKLLIILVLFALIGALALYTYTRYRETHITTDDAYVSADIYTIAPKIDGTVKAVHVDDNTKVKKGELLVEIEPADYLVQVRQESSGLLKEKARLIETRAGVDAAKKRLIELTAASQAASSALELARANERQAESDAKRAGELYTKGYVSKEDHEKALTALDVARAQERAARMQLGQAEAAVKTQQAVIKAATSGVGTQEAAVGEQAAKLGAAELTCGYTRICSPADGYVTRKSVWEGNQVKANQPLMAVTSLDRTWIVANYKETQLANVRPGQSVEIKVDTYPGKTFRGKVDSIMAGTGAAFSLFPPENATGNYVKIVQRVPVKIVLDGTSDGRLLRVGMSVVPTIIAR